MIYLYIFILLDETHADPGIAEQDEFRRALTSKLRAKYADIEVDIFFTRDDLGGSLKVEFVPFESNC